jgi:hypothetical protein
MNIRLVICAALLIPMLAGCGNEGAEIRVGLQNCSHGDACPEFHVSITDGFWEYTRVLEEPSNTIGPLPTRTSGILRIEVCLYLNGEVTETSGAIELSLRNDWRWGVDLFIQENDPIDVCFGCFGSEAFDLDPVLGFDANERLYIVWGGNSISNPVDY